MNYYKYFIINKYSFQYGKGIFVNNDQETKVTEEKNMAQKVYDKIFEQKIIDNVFAL